jgi:hypothetical protein
VFFNHTDSPDQPRRRDVSNRRHQHAFAAALIWGGSLGSAQVDLQFEWLLLALPSGRARGRTENALVNSRTRHYDAVRVGRGAFWERMEGGTRTWA